MTAGPARALVVAVLGGLLMATAAQAARATPIGPRAIAMGNAFTAAADDATSIFWNPAGLSRVGHQEIQVTHADLFGTGIRSDVAAFVLPISPSWAVGADWFHTGFDDGELDYGDNRFDLAAGVGLRRGLSVGMNLKYLSRSTKLNDVAIEEGSGAGLDAGVLWTPFHALRLGAGLQDAFDTRLHDRNGGGSEEIYGRSLRIGAAARPIRSALVAFDIDDRIHLGAEVAPLSVVALRAGIEKDRAGTGEPPTWGAGVGIQSGLFRIDYALSMHPTLGSTHHFGLAMDFNFNPSQVRIEKVETREVFSSLGKTYAREPLGTVRARNLQDRPLPVRLRVFSPDLMDQPTEQDLVLRPRATQDLPLTAVLSEKVVDRSGDRRVPLTVELSYLSERLPRTERRTTPLVAYGPGAIRWDEGVEQAAAYVTSGDPVVADFARAACWPVAVAEGGGFPNRNLAFTAAIVDALETLGVAYVPDPNNPFPSASRTAGVVDNIQYPRETLARRAGDCDDTTVLLAALLGNVGVPTRLVDVPGHLFLLAGMDLHERNRLALGIDERFYVIVDEQVWLPIETTAIGKGFAHAWEEGADAYASWAGRGRLEPIAVERAQSRYEPAELPEPEPGRIASFDSTGHAVRLARDVAAVAARRSEFRSGWMSRLKEGLTASPAALNEVAHAYFAAGAANEARESLQRALASDPGSARTHNNLADVLARLGDHRGALEHYAMALAADSTDAGIWLNLGLVREATGDTLGAERPLARGLSLSGGYTAACALLGIPPVESPVRGETARMSAAEARALLRAALAAAPVARDSTDLSSTAPHIRPVRRWRTRVAAARSGQRADLALDELLYWKE